MRFRDVMIQFNTQAVYRRHPKRHEYGEFNFESGCMESLYSRCLPKFETPATCRIAVELYDLAEPELAEPETIGSWDVIIVTEGFPFDEYQKSSLQEKKRLIVEVLHATCLRVVKHQGWDTAPFVAAYEECLRRDLVNEGFLWKGKAKLSPNRKVKAKVFFEFGNTEIEVFVVIYDRKGNELGRKLATTLLPNSMFLLEIRHLV